MPRKQFPDPGSRVVTAVGSSGRADAFAGRAATLYTDPAAVNAADISTSQGGLTLAGSTLTLDVDSAFPRFWGPEDGTDTLYARVVGRHGIVRVTADVDSRIDVGFDGGQAAATNRNVAHRGINLAGAEFGTVGDAYGTSWRYPQASDYTFVASRGYTLVRLPFLWERLQPVLSGPLDNAERDRLLAAAENAKAAGVGIVLDLHNYAKYGSKYLGESGGPTLTDFTNIWLRIAKLFANESAVIGYGLMNEPRSMPTVGEETGRDRWVSWSQAVLTAIRATGDTKAIMVSGYSGGSIGGWNNATLGTPRPWITDPAGNFFYEGHHYADGGTTNDGTYGGTYAEELAATSGWGSGDTVQKSNLSAIHSWLNWLRIHNVRGFIGEFGWPRVSGITTAEDSVLWNACADQILSLVDAYGPMVWTAMWATGSKWSAGYNLNLYLNNGAGQLATPAENAATAERHATSTRPNHIPRQAICPIDFGQRWRGYNADPILASATGNLTGGQPLYTLVEIVSAGRIDQIVVNVNTAGATPTADQCFAALYDLTGARIGVTADIGAVLTTGTGFKTLDLTEKTRVFSPGERVYAMLLFNGTTPPNLARVGTTSGILSGMTRRWGLGSAATAAPDTVSLGALTATTGAIWVGVAGY